MKSTTSSALLIMMMVFVSFVMAMPFTISSSNGTLLPKIQFSEREKEQSVIEKAGMPRCSPAGLYGKENGILLPQKHAKIPINQPFKLYYCSPTYHETRSISYDVIAMNKDNPNNGMVLAAEVKEPIIEVTIPDVYYDYIGVFERQSGYAGDQFATFNKAVNTCESEAS
ncbi:unnamed protein product [Sympodiomycopsis kandeliae]